jgi:signal transduction histidine kinase
MNHNTRLAAMRLLSIAAVLVAALAVVATLQYRWIGDVAAAEEQRARALRDVAAQHFAGDVDREAAEIAGAFQAAHEDELPARVHEWTSLAHDPRLIEAIYVADLNKIRRFDGEKLVDATWPESLKPVRDIIGTIPQHRRSPFIEAVPAIVMPLRPQPPRFPPPFGGPPPFRPPGRGEGPGPPPRPGPPQILIVQISRDYLAHTFFPELTRRYFGGEYDVSVVNGNQFVYRSDPKVSRAEVSLPLFRIGPPDRETGWHLFVHRRGAALEDVVAESRRRNLIISSAVLALLAGSVILLAVLARRAERQRLQQLEFVAGITHEVNTPLAALTSAGQNLADGVVTDGPQVARYGAMVVKESRRLSDLVAQVLDFSGLQARGASPKRERVDVASLIEEAIAQSRWIAEEYHVDIEKNLTGDLPAIEADAPSLTRAIQNLIANAIRHGGEGGWVGVRALHDDHQVSIVVEDRGRGIAARDIRHLFEPFYRGRGSDRVRGTGLGLTIVQQIARAHGGAVTVDHRRAQGAAFTLRIPEASDV